MNQVMRQVKYRLVFGKPMTVRPKKGRNDFAGCLDGTFGPPKLLRFKCGDLYGKFSWAGDLQNIFQLPTGQLSPVTQVHILCQSVGLPSTRIYDRLPPPDPCSAVKVKEEPTPAPGSLLDGKVSVDPDGLSSGQQRVIGIRVPPTCLHHSDFRISEIGNRFAQEIRRGNKVRVKDSQKFSSSSLHSFPECPCFKTMPVISPDVNYRQALLSIARSKGMRNFRGIVSGVVEELNFQPVARVIKRANSLKEPANHIALIVDRELNGDLRRVVVPGGSIEISETTAVLDQSFSTVAAKPQ